MKFWSKKIVLVMLLIALSFLFFSFSCSNKSGNNISLAFAENSPRKTIPADALSVLEAMQTSFRAISTNVLPSVVEIDIVETKTQKMIPRNAFPFFFFGQPEEQGEDGGDTREFKQQGTGSGVIVKRDKNTFYLLTNNHVVGKATEISVKLYDERVFKGKLVGADERKDIALVSFESDDKTIPIATLGDSDSVQTGDIVVAMGTPLGYFSSVTQGIVSATGRAGSGIGNISDFIQTDAAINQGNSGGPLLNIYGEVIGINTWIASSSGGSQGLGFAIPINNVKKSIEAFIKDGKVTYGWIGVSLIETKKEYQENLGVGDKTGALASQIFTGSPAQKGGLQAGDYVIALDGKPVRSVDQLVRSVGELTVGETSTFKVIRNGKEIDVKIKIEERTSDIVVDNSKLWPGFIPSPLSEDIKQQFKIEDDKIQGVVVLGIQAKTPGAIIGLQPGDVIVAVNDTAVTTIKEFYHQINTSNKKEIWFDIYRSGHVISTVKYKIK
ncbi:MAG: Do family serine endopeptidase [Treponemataceae bacterium]